MLNLTEILDYFSQSKVYEFECELQCTYGIAIPFIFSFNSFTYVPAYMIELPENAFDEVTQNKIINHVKCYTKSELTLD